MLEFGPRLRPLIIEYDDAFLACLTFEHNGYYDWRLPTRAEYFDSGLTAGVWYETKPDWRRTWYVVPVRDKND